jgi:dTDP-4-amino-4,6-dideoxygalactose transaminase
MNTRAIPLLDLNKQYSAIKSEIHLAIDRVLDSQQFILGSEVESLERVLADYCQCKYAFGVSSGTDAILVSLMAIGIQPGDEVITTPYTFSSTVLSIVRLGAIPIYVDINPLTFNIQANLIEQAVTSKTKAILPVHLAGQTCDMDPILDVAARYGLFVIEDACQAIGADYKGKRTGSLGHLGCFSFYPSKNLGGYGDSGLVTTNRADLAEKIHLLRNHGQQPKYHNRVIGGNFRMDAIQAAVLGVKFKYLEEWNNARGLHAATYREWIIQSGITISYNEIESQNGIFLPHEADWGRHIYHLFMIRTRNRDQLRSHLAANHIGSEIYYPVPLHLQECFSKFGYKIGDYPQSEMAALETLALPIYPELTSEMICKVVDVIVDFYKSNKYYLYP